jgi:hypothetical protein
MSGILLRAGELQLRYEDGFLRHFQIGETEVLRMMYFALRDHNWGTFTPIIELENIQVLADHFYISYQCRHQLDGQDCYIWKVNIIGSADGRIEFDLKGTALRYFRTNRAGFCVLHPIQGLAGEPVQITHANSEVEHSFFPKFIAPFQPIQDIKAMQWQIAGSPMLMKLNFEGDVFETEDHRNWGDANYKTYCTPIERPFPVDQHAGDEVRQNITFSYQIDSSSVFQNAVSVQLPANGRTQTPLNIGIGAALGQNELEIGAAKKLAALHLSHYRADVTPAQADWVVRFSNDAANAHLLQLPLEIALHLSTEPQEELAAFVQLCQQNRLNIKYVLLFAATSLVTPPATIAAIPHLKKSLPNVQFGVGTNYNFTEVNRNRFDPGLADFVTFSFHPQEHAFDDLSVMENTETLLYTVESARAIYQLPVHISPITLRARFNPYATDPKGWVLDENRRTDLRQVMPFTTIWTQKCIAFLESAGAQSATFFQTCGLQGIIADNGAPYPVYDFFKNRNQNPE